MPIVFSVQGFIFFVVGWGGGGGGGGGQSQITQFTWNCIVPRT